jgi:hypothetical protein
MKKIGSILLLLVICFCFFACKHSSNRVLVSQDSIASQAPLYWSGDVFGDLFYRNARLVLPFDIDEVNKSYYIELHIDYSGSYFYEPVVRDLMALPNLSWKIDSTEINNQNLQRSTKLTGVNARIGDYQINNAEFHLKKFQGVPGDTLLGYISLDYFSSDIVIVDFIHSGFSIVNRKQFPTADYSNWIPYRIEDASISIPLVAEDSTLWFWLCPEASTYFNFGDNSLLCDSIYWGDIAIAAPQNYSGYDESLDLKRCDGIAGRPFTDSLILIIDVEKQRIALGH